MIISLSAEGTEIQIELSDSDLKLCLDSPSMAGTRFFGPAMKQMINRIRLDIWTAHYDISKAVS